MPACTGVKVKGVPLEKETSGQHILLLFCSGLKGLERQFWGTKSLQIVSKQHIGPY